MPGRMGKAQAMSLEMGLIARPAKAALRGARC
jgi:hypothetical protein